MIQPVLVCTRHIRVYCQNLGGVTIHCITLRSCVATKINTTVVRDITFKIEFSQIEYRIEMIFTSHLVLVFLQRLPPSSNHVRVQGPVSFIQTERIYENVLHTWWLFYYHISLLTFSSAFKDIINHTLVNKNLCMAYVSNNSLKDSKKLCKLKI